MRDIMTVNETLIVPVLRGAGPVVLAGEGGLDRAVHWVHTTELADIGPMLRGGDLVLTTGIALPCDPDALTAFVESLDRSGVAGLVIELGRRWRDVPFALVERCEQLDMPLIALTREVRFAAVAQAVGEQIVDRQLEELREVQRVHEIFTELSISEADPTEILESVGHLAGAAVVLEDGQHTILDYRSGPGDTAAFLSDWRTRSRSVVLDGRTAWDHANGWLVTRVGKPDRGWGRLVIESPQAPNHRLVATAERAAAAMALHRLHDRRQDGPVRRTHHELILHLLTDPGAPDVHRRCEVAGFRLVGRRLAGLAVRMSPVDDRPTRTAEKLDSAVAALVHAAHEMRVPALVSRIDGTVLCLLSFPSDAEADIERSTADIAGRLRSRNQQIVVGAGRSVDRIGEIDRTLREALHVVDSLRPGEVERVLYRLEDVHLRGLLSMLADDDRLQLFVARELASLKEHDASRQTDLFGTLRALVRNPSSKSDAAAELHVSRSAFYDRLGRVADILGVDLDDPDILVSLHVAVLADDLLSERRARRLT